MPSTDSNTRSVCCPGCGAKYDFPIAMAGQKGRCAECGTKFVVPPAAITSADAPSTAPIDEPVEPAPEYVGFECRLCATRMFARPADVGKKMKCPDCHALTVIPPPPPPKKKNIPAALEGEQYELWEPDTAPLPEELIARQPKFIAVSCRKCATMMYARESEAGKSLTCPDCRTSTVVPQPPKPKPKVSVLAPDALTPKLDPAANPGERPPVIIPPRKPMVYEEQQEAAYEAALEKSRRTGKPMEIDSRGRPIIPRYPLLTGVIPFLFSRGIPAIYLGVAAAFFGSLTMVLYGAEMAMSGYGAVAGMPIFAIGCVFTMIASAAASSALITIVAESSEGNREIQGWRSPLDWMGDLLVMIVAVLASGAPGSLIAKGISLAIDLPSIVTGLAGAGSIVLFLPIILMSQLDIGSTWGIVSPRVLRSLAVCPFSWALFYLEIAAIAAVCGIATWFVAGRDPSTVLWLMPLYFVGLVLFARLLGRLGWRLAEATPPRA